LRLIQLGFQPAGPGFAVLGVGHEGEAEAGGRASGGQRLPVGEIPARPVGVGFEAGQDLGGRGWRGGGRRCGGSREVRGDRLACPLRAGGGRGASSRRRPRAPTRDRPPRPPLREATDRQAAGAGRRNRTPQIARLGRRARPRRRAPRGRPGYRRTGRGTQRTATRWVPLPPFRARLTGWVGRAPAGDHVQQAPPGRDPPGRWRWLTECPGIGPAQLRHRRQEPA
jgi:hypothetical protein